MKNLIVIFFLFVATSSFAQINFGAGIDTNLDAFGVKGLVLLQVSDQWSGQVGASVFLNNSNPTMLNFDLHYLLTTAGDVDAILVKGIGGLNYWSSGIEGAGGELGINIGANVKFPITSSFDAYIEPKVSILSVGDFFISAGIYF